MLTGAVIGVVVALIMILQSRHQAKRGSGLPGEIERAMQGKGSLNLLEIAKLVGRESFWRRGYVAQAVEALVKTGKLRMIPAPPGTPQLQKVNVIKYELSGEVTLPKMQIQS